MNWFDSWALTLTVLIPAVGAVVVHAHPARRRGGDQVRRAPRDARDVRRDDRHRCPASTTTTAALLQFDVNKQWIDVINSRYHVGDRRDLAADARAVGVHHRLVRRLLVEPLPRAAQPEGVPRADPDPRDRHERHVHRPGPDPLLRVLRDRAAPDVLHDRRLGRPEPRVRVDQVLPVHAVRLGADAAELPGALLQGRRRRRTSRASQHSFDMVLLSQRGRRGPRAQHADPDLRGHVPRLRDQGADVPVPHVAARRAHRGADGRFGAAGRDPAEARRLRLHPHRAADAPARPRRRGRRGSAASP